jgi:hypothetical protein
MRRWLNLWYLRRQRDRMAAQCEWFEAQIKFDQLLLRRARLNLCRAQGKLIAAQTVDALPDPHHYLG